MLIYVNVNKMLIYSCERSIQTFKINIKVIYKNID